MIPQTELDEIERAFLRIDEPGLRKVCAFCNAHLPGSDLFGYRVSHGVCSPRCTPAREMGWVDEPDSENPANDGFVGARFRGEAA
jgi:hypothetical protein